MTMRHFIVVICIALSASLLIACGDDSGTGPADLSRVTGDMAVGGCPQPSDTCVMNPTTHTDIINGCVAGDVVKVDITPYYPASGYEGCALPAR
jgi:hypothetical protein